MFPYTEYWTGKNRPDGFCSLIYFNDASLRKPVKHNWSYDAKYTKSKKGYDLNIDEERKAWDYVAALMKQPELQVQGNELNGHAIISNSLDEKQMKKVAKFVRREHRIGSDHPSFKIVFIRDGFWKEMYDVVRDNEAEFRRRSHLLAKRFSKLLSDENSDGYVLLNQPSAVDLCAWVRRQREIEDPPDTELLAEGLAETMTRS